MLLVTEERAGGGRVGGLFIGPSPPVLPSICILILYKSAACSMGLSEMDAQVYNTLGRRYGNEGNIIPRSHNPPHPPTHPAIWAKGGGGHGKYVSSLLVASHKCYGPICGAEGSEAAAVPGDRLMGLAQAPSRRRCTRLLIIQLPRIMRP